MATDSVPFRARMVFASESAVIDIYCLIIVDTRRTGHLVRFMWRSG
jgi:hypothetical protein